MKNKINSNLLIIDVSKEELWSFCFENNFYTQEKVKLPKKLFEQCKKIYELFDAMQDFLDNKVIE